MKKQLYKWIGEIAKKRNLSTKKKVAVIFMFKIMENNFFSQQMEKKLWALREQPLDFSNLIGPLRGYVTDM